MLSEELLKKVRQIEMITRKIVSEVMTGQFKSHFKGQGVQFSDHRVYMAGDDIRHIDWKASARTREPLIKKFEEERELTVLLVVDLSGSENFGTTGKLKSEVAAELAGMLALAAVHTGDRAGLLIFAGEVEHIVPPGKGRQHVLRMIRDILAHKTQTAGTGLAKALESAGRVMKHSGVVFVISDFIAQDYEIAIKRLARRHDLVAITVQDLREQEVPPLGHFIFVDPETGEERFVDTASYSFKRWLEDFRTELRTDSETALKGGRVERMNVLTRDDYGEALVRFFRARARRRR